MLIIGLILILLALGVPLFAVIAAAVLLGFHGNGIDLSVVGIEFYRLTEMPMLIAIPLFAFAGFLLGESRTPDRLVQLTNALVGRIPSGLAVVALIACSLFTAFTGATGITIVALGALLYPALRQAHYPEKFNTGLITTGGSLGLLFAPSLPLILYGVVAQQLETGKKVSIDELFIAGILPGLLMLAMLSAYCMYSQRKSPHAVKSSAPGELLRSVRGAAWEIPLPIVVLGGIYSGYFAVSEAAAVTALYALIVTVFIRREIKWSAIPDLIRRSMILVGSILIILGMSMASTNYLIDANIPNQIFSFIRTYVEDKTIFLLTLNIFLLITGMLLDIFPAIVLLPPLVLPLALAYGVDPVHLGIIFLANMQLGYLLPPLGISLFIASSHFNKPMHEVYISTIPFFIVLFIAVLLITYCPDLSLFLLR